MSDDNVLHALAHMGLTSKTSVSAAKHAVQHSQVPQRFASPPAGGDVAPTAPDIATPSFTPTAEPPRWHSVGCPTAALGLRLSWRYVPLLHAAVGVWGTRDALSGKQAARHAKERHHSKTGKPSRGVGASRRTRPLCGVVPLQQLARAVWEAARPRAAIR